MDSVPAALQQPWRQSAKILPATGTGLLTIASAGTTNARLAPTKIFTVIAAHDVKIGITDFDNTFTILDTYSTCGFRAVANVK